MKPHLDKSADALYIRLHDSAIVESEEISPGVVIDYNESNEIAGIEVLRLSQRLATPSASTPTSATKPIASEDGRSLRDVGWHASAKCKAPVLA